MSGSTSEESIIQHETGHAAGLLYLGFGAERITIGADHGELHGSTKQRMPESDLPRYHRVVAFLAGFRAEQDDLRDELEGTRDLRNARLLARELLGAESDTSPEVTAMIRRAWSEAGAILAETVDFRSAARDRLRVRRPFPDKTIIDVDDLWEMGIGYEIGFDESDAGATTAYLTLDGQAAGYVTFTEEDVAGRHARLVRLDAATPQQFRRRGMPIGLSLPRGTSTPG